MTPANAPGRILVVDDNPAIHEDFRKILCPPPPDAALGAAEAALFGAVAAPAPVVYALDAASQGAEALARVREALCTQDPYALAFVDVRMPPGWDGIETVQHLWQADPDLQVVFCTAYADYSWEGMRERLGAADGWLILKKPFDPIEVLQMAAALTNKWALARQARATQEDLRRLVGERTRELETVSDSASDAIILLDGGGSVVSSNRAAQSLFGQGGPKMVGQLLSGVIAERSRDRYEKLLGETLRRGDGKEASHGPVELTGVRGDGAEFPLDLSAASWRKGGQMFCTLILRDLTERKRAETALRQSEEELRRLAFHDPLTGLPNRLLIKDHLGYALPRARRTGRPLALLFLDLDNFKWVNDTMGHPVGDALLEAVAGRLTAALRRQDVTVRFDAADASEIVARLGGDEFLVLLQDFADPYDAGRVAQRLLDVVAKPITLAGQEFRTTASIGIAVYPGDGDGVDDLLRSADMAMYHAKEQGKGRYEYCSEAMREAALQRLKIETRLRKALDEDRLQLHYQPQLEAATGRVLGFEALLRWDDPEMGKVAPATFIPLAEESGLIVRITAWAVREACRQTKAWQDAGLGRLRVSVNVSGVDIGRSDLRRVVAGALEETGLDSACLEVELTETSVMAARDAAGAVLQGLKELGVGVSLDDFGTGYSSLNSVRRFPLDELKIDRAFLSMLPRSRDDAVLVSTIIAIARTLGLSVVAEGVETREQLEFLQRAGCDTVQGFLVSPAIPPQAVPGLLRRQAWLGLHPWSTGTDGSGEPRQDRQDARVSTATVVGEAQAFEG